MLTESTTVGKDESNNIEVSLMGRVDSKPF